MNEKIYFSACPWVWLKKRLLFINKFQESSKTVISEILELIILIPNLKKKCPFKSFRLNTTLLLLAEGPVKDILNEDTLINRHFKEEWKLFEWNIQIVYFKISYQLESWSNREVLTSFSRAGGGEKYCLL